MKKLEELCELKAQSKLAPQEDMEMKIKNLKNEIVKLKKEVKEISLDEDAFKTLMKKNL